jgi:hypothetical protein
MARLALLILLVLSSTALAEPLRIERSQEKMKVDGALLEWRGARFHELGSGDDARIRYAIASVDGGLYLGAEIFDDSVVLGDKGDALVLTLVMPQEGTSEVWLFPGRGSERARALLSRNGAAPQLQAQIPIVEGPVAHGVGYVIEAFIPWRVIPGSAQWHDARGALRFVDSDGGKAPTLLRSDPGTPSLSLGIGQEDMLGSFLSAHDLVGVPPRYDWRDNVAGDERRERVVIIGQYVVVFGPGFKNGESYNYNLLPFAPDAGLRSAQLIDLTGDGVKELVASGRQSHPLGLREVWLVIKLEELGMKIEFGIETKKESKGGFLENTVAIVPPKGKELPRIEQQVSRANGLDASTYHEAPATDMQPVLLPWGEVSARAYAWDGKKFRTVDEKRRAVPQAATLTQPLEAPPETAGRDALIEAFKQQQGIPESAQPSQSLRANIALGPQSEQIDVFGKVLMFSGPEIGDGNGFMGYGTPVADARDLLEVRAADVTGDERAELLLRVRQPLSGANAVTRELLLVLSADGQGRFARIGLIEIARRQGGNAIENQFSVKGGTLTIAPGGARGWTAASYPFADEPTGGAGKLLLPWKDKPSKFNFASGALTPN